MNISFIIPAYNASATIIRALDSIYALLLDAKQFEVIVVDDCSTDNTREIVADYIALHPQVRLLCQKENHRQGAARNRGVREAKGEYIMFVDADDKVENGVPTALTQAIQQDVDAMFCNYIWMYSAINEELRKMPLKDGFVTSGQDFAEHYYETIVNTCPISYFWKRDYLLNKGVPFVEDRQMEDFDFIEQNVYHTSKIGYSTAIIYRVLTYENLSSTTHTCSPETSADWAHVAYRRMIFCDTIREESPNFVKNIEYQSRCFAGNILKFRNITKFSPREVKHLYDRLGKDAMLYFIQRGGWNYETHFCLCHPYVTIAIDSIAYPVASIGRLLIHSLRKKK